MDRAWSVVVAAVPGLLTVGCGSDALIELNEDPPNSITYPDDGQGGAEVGGPDGSGVAVVVDRVVDGDSLELTVDGEPVELRLEGFNAPELYADGADGSDFETCNGLASRAAVDESVSSASDLELLATGEDRFGRTLGDLLIDGDLLVPQLVLQGRGLATGDSEEYRDAMAKAADAGVGIWGNGCGDPLTTDLRIGDSQIDAPGNDRNNLVDEWVEVVNEGLSAVNLEGWVLRDDTTGHHFPLAGILEAGARLTVRTGGDPDDSELNGSRPTLYLGERFPVWSNSGETILLIDPNGVFAHWRFVGA